MLKRLTLVAARPVFATAKRLIRPFTSTSKLASFERGRTAIKAPTQPVQSPVPADKLHVDFQARTLNVEGYSKQIQNMKQFKVVAGNKRNLWLQVIDESDSNIAAQQIAKQINNTLLDDPDTDTQNSLVTTKNDAFIILYSFGSVVFVNMPNVANQKKILDHIKNSGSCATVHEEWAEDDCSIVIDGDSKEWSKAGRDHFAVKVLDINNTNVISGVLARSVAVESYENQTGAILEKFKNLHQIVMSEPLTWLSASSRLHVETSRKMRPVIAESNQLKCDLMLNVRIFERPPESWEYDQYDKLYEALSLDFEIADRYHTLEKKLEFIQSNTQFYMELQQSKKTERQEWLIILLIFTEIVIALTHHYAESQAREEKKKRGQK